MSSRTEKGYEIGSNTQPVEAPDFLGGMSETIDIEEVILTEGGVENIDCFDVDDQLVLQPCLPKMMHDGYFYFEAGLSRVELDGGFSKDDLLAIIDVMD